MPYPAASCGGVALSPSHSGARRKLVQALDTIGRLEASPDFVRARADGAIGGSPAREPGTSGHSAKP